MNTTAEQESLAYFARFMRLYPVIEPITREVAAALEAVKDSTPRAQNSNAA